MGGRIADVVMYALDYRYEVRHIPGLVGHPAGDGDLVPLVDRELRVVGLDESIGTENPWCCTQVHQSRASSQLEYVDEQRLKMHPVRAPELVDGREALLEESIAVLDVSRDDFRTATELASQADYRLRSGDPLHLAVVGAHAATLYTLDQKLRKAGPAVAVDVRSP